jgi:hypothetical protein
MMTILLWLTGCDFGTPQAQNTVTPYVIADARGVLFNPCGGTEVPTFQVKIEDLEVRVKDLLNSDMCSYMEAPARWPQGRSIGVGRTGMAGPKEAAKIDSNVAETKRILTSLGLEVTDTK